MSRSTPKTPNASKQTLKLTFEREKSEEKKMYTIFLACQFQLHGQAISVANERATRNIIINSSKWETYKYTQTVYLQI